MKQLGSLLMALTVGLLLQTSGCALLIAGAAGGGAAGVAVSANKGREEHHAPMTYVGTVLANVVYCPTKVVFAVAGAATSGVAYVATLGSQNPTATIWNASVKGNYVMTPSMVEGTQPVQFIGASSAA